MLFTYKKTKKAIPKHSSRETVIGFHIIQTRPQYDRYWSRYGAQTNFEQPLAPNVPQPITENFEFSEHLHLVKD
jgi:hypothetical protein